MNKNKIKFGRSLVDTLYFVWEKLLHFATAKEINEVWNQNLKIGIGEGKKLLGLPEK